MRTPWKTPIAPLALAGALALAGCGGGSKSTAPVVPTPPSPNSPTNVVARFAWGWNHLDKESFRQILTGDFTFAFAAADSAGNPFPNHGFGRDTLLTCAQHIFSGGGTEPKATRITLTLDPALIVVNDSRTGKNPGWHKQITTSVNLYIKADTSEYRIGGNARFFVVRGDSAVIPADLAAQGVVPDASRWYMDRWEDQTLSVIGPAPPARATYPARPTATHSTSWGAILALYK